MGPLGTVLSFELAVTDSGGLQATDACSVTVSWDNRTPLADAGADQSVMEGTTVSLDGTASSDPDGDADTLTFLWTQTGGPDVTLSDPTLPTLTFVTPPVSPDGATLVFELTVRDFDGLAASTAVTIKIQDNGITIFPDGIITTRLSSGMPIGIETDRGCSLISLYTIDPQTISVESIKTKVLLDDLIDMKIKVPSAGERTHVTFYLAEPLPDNSTLYHYSLEDNLWTDYSEFTEFSYTGDQVKVLLADGGVGDDDGTVNGVIVDPFVFVLGSGDDSSSPLPEESGGRGGCFISTSAHKGTPCRDTHNTLFLAIHLFFLAGVIILVRRE